jgi:hypothetical protein
VVEFATLGNTERSSVTQEQARVLMENLKALDEEAFRSDQELSKELALVKVSSKPIGIILLSRRETCVLCGSKLLIRSDKPSSVVLYDDNLGTLPGTHFHKYCSKRSCSCTQYYSFYTVSDSHPCYDKDCMKLAYCVSTRETAVKITMLKNLDAEN